MQTPLLIQLPEIRIPQVFDQSDGFATKTDIEELTKMINNIKQEILTLKGSLPTPPKKKKETSS